MLFVPKHLVVGLYTPPLGVGGTPVPTMDALNRIWTEVTATYDYRQFQVSTDRTGAVFTGTSESDGVTIQPPLLQVRAPIEMTAAKAADKARDVLAVIGRNLGVEHFSNLGIRHIYHVVVPDGDGRSLLLRTLMRQRSEETDILDPSGQLAGGVKFVIRPEDRTYTLVMEPLFADMTFLYVDLDAQFRTPVLDLESVKTFAGEAEAFITGEVNSYLDRSL